MTALDSFRLHGTTAVVTGGGRGLGAVMACSLAGAGATVVVVGRRPAPLDDVVRRIVASGGRAEAGVLDVSDADAVDALFSQVAERHRGVHVLANNAGIQHEAPATAIDPAAWRRVIDTNLGGTFNCSRAFAAVADGDAPRAIVNVASIAATVGVRNQAAYAASKGGIVSLTRALALEFVSRNIRVNAVVPGYFRTDMPAAVLADARLEERLLRKIPMRRIGVPEEIGPAVLFLASPASSYMTGATLHVDGGYTAQ